MSKHKEKCASEPFATFIREVLAEKDLGKKGEKYRPELADIINVLASATSSRLIFRVQDVDFYERAGGRYTLSGGLGSDTMEQTASELKADKVVFILRANFYAPDGSKLPIRDYAMVIFWPKEEESDPYGEALLVDTGLTDRHPSDGSLLNWVQWNDSVRVPQYGMTKTERDRLAKVSAKLSSPTESLVLVTLITYGLLKCDTKVREFSDPPMQEVLIPDIIVKKHDRVVANFIEYIKERAATDHVTEVEHWRRDILPDHPLSATDDEQLEELLERGQYAAIWNRFVRGGR